MTDTILLNYYYEIRWGLALLSIILLSLAYLFNKLTAGYIFNFTEKIQNKKTTQFLLSLQWIISILLAFILPNNYLAEIRFFQDVYSENQLWIPVSMIGVFCTTLIIIGFIFNILIKIINKKYLRNGNTQAN
ncbi:MAG: hypothetical protein ACOYO1_17720 [Bacteroidales bacterium]